MKIIIKTNLMTATKAYKKGQVTEVKDQEALALIKAKLAEQVDNKSAKEAADEAKAAKEAAEKAATPETATTDTKSEKATTNKK